MFYKGGSSYGELGNGDTGHVYDITESPISQTLKSRGEKIIDIKCGDHNTVLLTDQGKLYITGYCLQNTFAYNGQTKSLGYSEHLTAYAQVDLPQPIAHICCSYYHFCFTAVSGDLYCSKGLLDITNTLGKGYNDSGISGPSVECDHIESKQVSDAFGSQFASVSGGDYTALVITKTNEVYLPYNRNNYATAMKKLDSDLVRSIMEYGASLASSIGESYCAIYSQQSTNRSYSAKLHTQAHRSNPFIDIIIQL